LYDQARADATRYPDRVGALDCGIGGIVAETKSMQSRGCASFLAAGDPYDKRSRVVLATDICGFQQRLSPFFVRADCNRAVRNRMDRDRVVNRPELTSLK